MKIICEISLDNADINGCEGTKEEEETGGRGEEEEQQSLLHLSGDDEEPEPDADHAGGDVDEGENSR